MDPDILKTTPFAHQRSEYEDHWADRARALFWEMGLGKTKTLLDQASRLHHERRLDAVLVIAPKAVYQNWLQEAAEHLAAPYVGMAWHTSGHRSERSKMKCLMLLDPSEWIGKLRLVCISYNGLKTDAGAEFAERLLLLYRTMMIADESTAIKSSKTDTAKLVKRLGKLSHYRRIATGTPVAQSPFDVHSQIEFLEPDFWRNHGMRSVEAFRQSFGEFEIRTVGRGRKFNELRRYRNLERLGEILRPISSRLLKEDSQVKLPPKLFSLRRFELAPDQRRLYDQIAQTFVAELDGGMYLEAPMAITRAMRLQQITSGHVTAEEFAACEPEDEELEAQQSLPGVDSVDYGTAMDVVDSATPELDRIRPLMSSRRVVDVIPPKDNPRLELLLQILDETAGHKAIVWCRFRRDVEIICEALGDRAVRYDGSVNTADREEALRRFKDPASSVSVLVANVHAISQGVTLTIAKTAIYYSNSFSLEKRLQSEDRPHRIGQDKSVLVVDIVAEDTIDEHVVKTLREKYDVAAQVTGDRLREWIGRADS